MEYEEYKETVIDKQPESKGLLYQLAVLWLHPNRLPLAAVHLGNCTDKIIKIPNWSEEKRVVQFSSGPEELTGPKVPVIAFSKNLFRGNIHITDVILQSNIEKIPTGAFAGCSELERITIPKSIKYIGEATFEKCNHLQDVYYAGSKEDWDKVEIVHKGSRVKDPKQLGLHVDIEHFEIPGNEALLNAMIHYNCDPNAESISGIKLVAAGKDVTKIFTVRDD